MHWWGKLFGKEKKLNAQEKAKTAPTPPASPGAAVPIAERQAASYPKEHLKTIMSIARKADWHDPSNAGRLLEPIKNTWGVDCTIVRLTEQQVQEIEQQYPLDTNFTDISQQYHIRLSANSIFIHEHGSWINFGYLKFLYHDSIYYVNVTPLVDLTTSLFDRTDDLSHMAKIMISLGERGRSDRRSFVIRLEGDLVQNE